MSRPEGAVRPDTVNAGKAGYALPDAPRLFRQRLFAHWREQYRMIRMVADWIVLLYIIVPGLLLGGRIYFGFWNGEAIGWTAHVPFALIPAALTVLLATGGLLLLVREADSLFLLQRRQWISSLMLRSILYSLGVTAVKIGAAFVLLLPFIIKGYGVAPAAAWALLALTVSCGLSTKLLVHLIRVSRQGLGRQLWLILALLLSCGSYLYAALAWENRPWLLAAAALLYAAVTLWAIRHRLTLQGTFMQDVRESLKQRMRIASLMLAQVVDKPRPTRHKPWIFRRSQPLLASRKPEARFCAAGIKAFIRNPGHLKLYLQFTGVGLGAVLIVPSWLFLLKWLIFLVLTTLMAYWLSSYWLVFAGDDYIGILPFTKTQKADTGTRLLQLLIQPFSVLCAAAVCIPLYGWLGLLLFIPAGLLAGYIAASAFSTFRFSR